MKKIAVCGALCASLLVSGCSGSSVLKALGLAPDINLPVYTPPNLNLYPPSNSNRSFPSSFSVPSSPIKESKAAAINGAVSQSSNVNNNNVTQDAFHVAVSGGATDPDYAIRYDATGDGIAEFSINTRYLSSSAASKTYVSGSPLQAAGIRGVSVDSDGDNSDDGRLYMLLFTNYHRTADAAINDTDYTVNGIWMYAPFSYSATEHAMGTFFDMPQEYKFANINAAQGQATYQGAAWGLYFAVDPAISSGSYSEIGGGFAGNVALNANFDTNKIGGSLGNLETFNESNSLSPYAGVSYNGVIQFSETDIVSQNNGADNFFSGVASGTLTDDQNNSISPTGNWGGAFFGGNGANGDQPEGVGGTFAGEALAGNGVGFHFLGSFGASKQ